MRKINALINCGNASIAIVVVLFLSIFAANYLGTKQQEGCYTWHQGGDAPNEEVVHRVSNFAKHLQ